MKQYLGDKTIMNNLSDDLKIIFRKMREMENKISKFQVGKRLIFDGISTTLPAIRIMTQVINYGYSYYF